MILLRIKIGTILYHSISWYNGIAPIQCQVVYSESAFRASVGKWSVKGTRTKVGPESNIQSANLYRFADCQCIMFPSTDNLPSCLFVIISCFYLIVFYSRKELRFRLRHWCQSANWPLPHPKKENALWHRGILYSMEWEVTDFDFIYVILWRFSDRMLNLAVITPNSIIGINYNEFNWRYNHHKPRGS